MTKKTMADALEAEVAFERRLAAALKCCEGISTEVLELNATAGGVATLERQRDEALAALNTLILFTKPTKTNAVALNHALRVAGQYKMSEKPVEPPTYHDVVVFAGEQRLRLLDCSYGLQLHCTRSAGWQLWNVWRGKEELLAGEYSDTKPIRIEVRGVVICETKPAEGDEA